MKLSPLIVVSLAYAQDDVNRPLNKVINLLTDMQNTVTKERKADDELWQKMSCWCETNRKAKDATIKEAGEKIELLSAQITEDTASIARLETEIKHLGSDIDKLHESLAGATKLRADQKADFEAEEKDLMETLESLKGAIDALQHLHKDPAAAEDKAAMFVQIAKAHNFNDVMRKDLWDLFGSMQDSEEATSTTAQIMAQLTDGKKAAQTGFLQQEPALRDYTKAQDADESGVTGNAAGVKSYNGRSGQIFGILGQMQEDFEAKLKTAQTNEKNAVKNFENLKRAKLTEISAAQKISKSKKKELGDTMGSKVAAAKDKKSTEEALSADQQFVLNMEKKCAHAEETYQARQSERGAELKSIAEALQILSNDESRALFHKTYNAFYQVKISSASENRQRNRASSKLMEAAKKTKNTVLAQLATEVKLDTFTKVKEVLNTLLADLKTQQAEERKKKDTCNEDLYKNKDATYDANKHLEDTNSAIAELEAQIESCEKEIEVRTAEIKDAQTQMQIAGKDRSEQNAHFQEVVKNNRLTANVLQKAVAALNAFYAQAEKKSAFAQVEKPGESAVGYAPPTAKESNLDYTPNQNSIGAVALLEGILADTNKMTSEMEADEQESQKSYEAFMKDSNSVIKVANRVIHEKSEEKAVAEGDKATKNSKKDSLDETLESLAGEKTDLHEDCDFVLNNYDARQSAREEEMDAIAQAMAVLSGADFS